MQLPIGLLHQEALLQCSGNIEPSLAELLRLRVSQINHCYYCIDMHTKECRAAGIDTSKLTALANWRESNVFSLREATGLALAEVSASGARDTGAIHQARAHFQASEFQDLVTLLSLINAWNRFSTLQQLKPGQYKAGELQAILNRFSAELSTRASDIPG